MPGGSFIPEIILVAASRNTTSTAAESTVFCNSNTQASLVSSILSNQKASAWIHFVTSSLKASVSFWRPSVLFVASGLLTILALSYFVRAISGGVLSGCPRKFRPMFYYCATTHARFTPTKHNFRFPILYVGFPVTARGTAGSLFGVKPSESEKEAAERDGKALRAPWTFFSVDPGRYIHSELPFDEKLRSLLTGHGLDPSLYPFAYFVTTPAFLGYSFNPVSYYYLYSASHELKAIVLEVINTFGEKHIYILHSDNPRNPSPRSGYDFAGTMEKVFHISSFNHRSGSYIIQVRDPTKEQLVDVHMSVFSQEGRKMMVARAFSTAKSFDLATGGWLEGWYIVLGWGWNNFIAMGATFYEAFKLYRKNTKTYVRPEPLKGTTKRAATRAEREMQALFLSYLKARVASFDGGRLEVKVTLPESNPVKPLHTVTFSNFVDMSNGEDASELHIIVLNPRFFLRFFACQDPVHMVWMDFSASSPEFHPAVCEKGDLTLLKDLLSTNGKQCESSMPSSWSWHMISRLRAWKTAKELASMASTTAATTTTGVTVTPPPCLFQRKHLNCIDEFYLVHKSACEGANEMYRWKVLHAVLADLIGFGDSSNLELYTSVLWGAFGAAVAIHISHLAFTPLLLA